MGYYNHRRHYYRNNVSKKTIDPVWILLLILLWPIGIVVLFIWIIIKLFKWLSGTKWFNQTFDSKKNLEEINSKRHGCKCYMEGLSDSEKDVAETLSHELSYKDYFIFNNLIIPSENNKSTQIDHIIISKFGIFVIESKDYKGWIFGDKDQSFWTQSMPGGKNKFKFQNPIRQNYGHIMALKDLLNISVDKFISVIVFSNRFEFKTAPIENVLNLDQLINYIKKQTVEKLTTNDIHLIIGKLTYACQTNEITISEHIKNIKENLEN